jgi:uncharacterized protein YdaU (DUF1376 family)
MHYYKFNIADWHLATSHLSLEEEAVYFKLINFYYDSEAAIPLETDSVIRRLRLGSVRETVGIVLKEFFVLQDDGWHHLRCDDEISKYHHKAEVNQRIGKLGGRPKKTESVSVGIPEITLTTNHKPITNNQYTSEFESFWKVYDKPSGKANAFKVWKSIKPDNTLMSTILQKATLQAKNVERKFRKDAERWLRDKRWEDEISDVQQVEKVKFI